MFRGSISKRRKKKLTIPQGWKKGMWILAATFYFQPSEIKELTAYEFADWIEAAEEINRSNNGDNI
jgi:hypothetical protein